MTADQPISTGPGGLVVVVPTYRRPRPLVWSLSSVLRQDLAPVGLARRRVVVVNNGGPPGEVEAAVELAVAECGANGWTLSVVHRDPPMDPALSWYGALQDETAEGDAAFLHGDDDLLLPGSLLARHGALRDAGAALLLSRAHAGLYFDGGAVDQVYLRPVPGPVRRPLTWRRSGPAGLAGSGAAFIGNHAYRIGPEFRAAVAQALAWATALPATISQRLGMLPWLVGLAVADSGGLASTEAACALRGQGTQDLVGARFGHSSWRPGVLYLTCLRVLCTDPLASRADLEPLREEYLRLCARWRLPSRFGAATRRDWEALDGDSLLRRHGPAGHRETLRGLAMVLRSLTGTQALRTRLFRWRDPLGRTELLNLLWRDHA